VADILFYVLWQSCCWHIWSSTISQYICQDLFDHLKNIKMQKTWNGAILPNMQELTSQESAEIVGGESLWYWVGYVVGGMINGVRNDNGVQSSGQKLMNAALG
jgi:hypothetical protein